MKKIYGFIVLMVLAFSGLSHASNNSQSRSISLSGSFDCGFVLDFSAANTNYSFNLNADQGRVVSLGSVTESSPYCPYHMTIQSNNGFALRAWSNDGINQVYVPYTFNYGSWSNSQSTPGTSASIDMSNLPPVQSVVRDISVQLVSNANQLAIPGSQNTFSDYISITLQGM